MSPPRNISYRSTLSSFLPNPSHYCTSLLFLLHHGCSHSQHTSHKACRSLDNIQQALQSSATFLIHSAPNGCHPDHSALLNTSTLGGPTGASMLCMCCVPFITVIWLMDLLHHSPTDISELLSYPLLAPRGCFTTEPIIPSNPTPHTGTDPLLQDQQGLSKEP